ncbi:hypothetical protein PYCCODRAFT_1461961 [Trametes coccinea BRFM310]|uniref:Uncharacterized protein n=1 Tax=Trametes coccinea (strain BRFM310) TaxID=1353009 RepID=A0A1Y2IBY9_TRAC3|nr:hypothetical protein PYCCODRAFT_1461961 [Trametes coccinea BRFM310]
MPNTVSRHLHGYIMHILNDPRSHLSFPHTITIQLSLDAHRSYPTMTTYSATTPAPRKVHFTVPNPSSNPPVKRRTPRSPAPKPKTQSKSKLFAFSRTPSLPRAQIRRLGDGRRVALDWVPIPEFAACYPPFEYRLLSLGEAQTREDIVRPSFDIDDDIPRAAEDQDGLSPPDREREQEQPVCWTSTIGTHGHQQASAGLTEGLDHPRMSASSAMPSTNNDKNKPSRRQQLNNARASTGVGEVGGGLGSP